jgi:crossover junction endodeoxyribonuclease RusA
MAEHRIDIIAPSRMLTINAERTIHWTARAAIVKLWRQAGWAEALQAKLPRLQAAEIDAYPVQKGVLADAGAHAPVVKALVDGLVDAHVLPDDSPAYLRALRIHPPTRGKPGVTLVVTDASASTEPSSRNSSPDVPPILASTNENETKGPA